MNRPQASSLSNQNLSPLPFFSNKRGAALLSGALFGGSLAAGGVWLTHRSVALIPGGALIGTALAWIALRTNQKSPAVIGSISSENEKKNRIPLEDSSPTSEHNLSSSPSPSTTISTSPPSGESLKPFDPSATLASRADGDTKPMTNSADLSPILSQEEALFLPLSPSTSSPAPPVQIGQFRIFNIQGEERGGIATLLSDWRIIAINKDLDVCANKYIRERGPIPEGFSRFFISADMIRMKSHPAESLLDCSAMCGRIAEKLKPNSEPSRDPWDTLLTSVDSSGVVQAVALYSEANNRLVDMVTHPKNIPLPEGEEPIATPTRGAGSSIMRYLLDKSFKSNRPLTLEALEKAVPFYLKAGLKITREGNRFWQINAEMRISPEEIPEAIRLNAT